MMSIAQRMGSPPGNELNNMGLGVMASIRLEDEARKDPRFGILGKRMGTSKFDARARMEELWAYCTEKQTYFLSAEIIDELAEFPNFSHLICEPEVSLAEACSEGIRIKGTKGRIEWIAKLRKNGKKGGRPRKTKTKPEANQNETRIEPPSNPLTLTPVLVPAPVKEKENIYTREEFASLETDWIGTLKHFGIERPVLPHEQQTLWQVTKAHGIKATRYAVVGMRYEESTSTFTPSKHVSLQRLFKGELFEKFVNLASAKLTEQKKAESLLTESNAL